MGREGLIKLHVKGLQLKLHSLTRTYRAWFSKIFSQKSVEWLLLLNVVISFSYVVSRNQNRSFCYIKYFVGGIKDIT